VIEEAEHGRLPGRKIGSDWRFLVLALVDWLRGEQQPRPEKLRAATTVGSELAEHIRRTGIPWTPEAMREAEQFIATVSGARKTRSVAG
jgi:hypothetical protein